MSFSGRLSFPSQSRELKKEGLKSHACKQPKPPHGVENRAGKISLTGKAGLTA